jgi:hypothetical protein
MVSRFVFGALVAGACAVPVHAQSLNPEQARQFVAGKLFAFTCMDGTRGAGRIHHDGSVAGSIQFGGSGPVRMARLPGNTIRISSTQVCASLKGLPFQPCFNLEKTGDVSFRGSVQGMGFAYCDFRRHGNSLLVARATHGPKSLRPRGIRSASASKPEESKVVASKVETVGKVETPKVEVSKIDPPKTEAPKIDAPKTEPASLDLRRSTD